ncbi:MAG: hypothetical protein M1815_005905 [Lichina confinis]|nr:MAG: hypothetical protein M1815_005905 [Lichina confinis]
MINISNGVETTKPTVGEQPNLYVKIMKDEVQIIAFAAAATGVNPEVPDGNPRTMAICLGKIAGISAAASPQSGPAPPGFRHARR